MRLNPLKYACVVVSEKFLCYMSTKGIEEIKALIEIRYSKKSKEIQSPTKCVVALSHFLSKAIDKWLLFFKGENKFQWTKKCEEAFQGLKKFVE